MKSFIENSGIIPCGCSDVTHHILYVKDPDDPEVYVYLQLYKRRFFSRLWRGIKYILGVRERYGMYHEFIVNEDNIHFFLEWNEHILAKTVKDITTPKEE